MNEFEYQLELAKIDSCKYVKDIRKLLYNYYHDYHISYWGNIKDLQSEIYKYHLYSKTFTKFTNISKTTLPDKFYTNMEEFQRKLLEYILNQSINFTYEQFLEVFKYTESITIPYMSDKNFYKLCNIVKDNPLPFYLTFKINHLVFKSYTYFNNIDCNKELTLLTWAKINNIPESYTILNKFRNINKYSNNQKNYDQINTERKNFELAIKAIDQLKGVPIVK